MGNPLTLAPVKQCRFCHDPIDKPKRYSPSELRRYLKRKYHKECQAAGMREDKVGFFDPSMIAIPVTKMKYVRGHIDPDWEIPDL